MAQDIHVVTEQFEKEISKYTGAPYVVCVDNQSNALFLCLKYLQAEGREIEIPKRTYPSVPCEIIHAGAKVKWKETTGLTLKGAYQLSPLPIWDSALRFTADMYVPNQFMCISFTGAYKHLKLSKGGAILLDDEKAYLWLKKARFSGRSECSYHDDNFDDNPVIGWNFYMMPELAIRGLQLIKQFYNQDGTKRSNPDVELSYPDLSKFKIFNK